MDLDKVKSFFNVFLTAFGIFVLIFILYSIIIASRIAQRKDRQEIKKDYAGEIATPTVRISP